MGAEWTKDVLAHRVWRPWFLGRGGPRLGRWVRSIGAKDGEGGRAEVVSDEGKRKAARRWGNEDEGRHGDRDVRVLGRLGADCERTD